MVKTEPLDFRKTSIILGLRIACSVLNPHTVQTVAECFFHLGFRAIAHPTQALLYHFQDNGI
jgi:hypothetical protein